MHTFLFTRRALVSLLLGTGLMGLLLFAGGLLLGLRLQLPATPPINPANGTPLPPPLPTADGAPLAAARDEPDVPPPAEPTVAEEEEDETPAEAEPPLVQPFSIQVATFADADNARRLSATLTTKGYSAYLVELAGTAAARLYAVRLGPFGDRGEAGRIAAEIRSQEGLEAIIRRR